MNENHNNMNFEPSEDEIKLVSKSLDEFNYAIVENENHKLINIVKYNDNHEIIGGLLGGTYWGWLYVDRLWIHNGYRRKGLGSELLKAAEEEAINRNCNFSHLDTMSFQALGFYKKHKYKVKTVIKNIPKGHNKYILVKKLKK